ncbi:type I-F CRISPR-associated protein Csy1 [Poseidonibacter antarcticus]|uniref:type I-F CRISPR-associated protein Csy1 n=1 Tax=Poseidonibacter antarcticus TaxID=2478538 RepID=UPI000EF4E447|nr:type I-F CRISPR-associated protein Csy1 [Poseidonibacter antarcticus]
MKTNKIKEYIDSVKKKKIKILLSDIDKTEKYKIQQIKENIESEFIYSKWITMLLSIKSIDSYFPKLDEEKSLFELLCLEVSYKQSFKLLCDSEHPLIKEALKDIGLNNTDIEKCIANVKNFSSEKLDYFLLFQNEKTINDVQRKIDNLAKDSNQGTIISHSSKMTHPSCKYPRIFFSKEYRNNGLVCSGNSLVEFDMHINATKLMVFKFLSLKYKNKPLLQYIKNNDATVFCELFDIKKVHAEKWVKEFSVSLNNEDNRTDRFIKQVYFPKENEYHLLSILHPSGLIFSMKEKIDLINHRSVNAYIGNKAKKNNKYLNIQFSTIPKLTVIKYGGEHPKNISGLNNKHQKHYLLNSMPPVFKKRNIYFPKSNFFEDSIRVWDVSEVFNALAHIASSDYNNIDIRNGRIYRYRQLMDKIIEKMWAVRLVSLEQYYEKNSKLKSHQKIWLCQEYEKLRENDDVWLDKLENEISRWIFNSYQERTNKKFSTEEKKDIKIVVHKYREELR